MVGSGRHIDRSVIARGVWRLTEPTPEICQRTCCGELVPYLGHVRREGIDRSEALAQHRSGSGRTQPGRRARLSFMRVEDDLYCPTLMVTLPCVRRRGCGTTRSFMGYALRSSGVRTSPRFYRGNARLAGLQRTGRAITARRCSRYRRRRPCRRSPDLGFDVGRCALTDYVDVRHCGVGNGRRGSYRTHRDCVHRARRWNRHRLDQPPRRAVVSSQLPRS